MAVRDLDEREVAFTLERMRRFRADYARQLARVALRNRAAALGGLAGGVLAAAAPLLLLPVLPIWAVGAIGTGWLLGLLRLVTSHEGLNAAVRRWRAEERGIRAELEALGGTVQALEARLRALGSGGA